MLDLVTHLGNSGSARFRVACRRRRAHSRPPLSLPFPGNGGSTSYLPPRHLEITGLADHLAPARKHQGQCTRPGQPPFIRNSRYLPRNCCRKENPIGAPWRPLSPASRPCSRDSRLGKPSRASLGASASQLGYVSWYEPRDAMQRGFGWANANSPGASSLNSSQTTRPRVPMPSP